MKLVTSFFSLLPLLAKAQDSDVGQGYVDNDEYATEYVDGDSEISSAPMDMTRANAFHNADMYTSMMGTTGADYEVDLNSLSPKIDMSRQDTEAMLGMAQMELEEEKSIADEKQPHLARTIEAAQAELAALQVQILDGSAEMTEQSADAITSKSFRGTNSCRSASTGRKSKKNGGCEAVLPVNLNYGCWCHADSNDIFKGKGQPVDEFDKACKMYKQCLRCVRLDARNDGLVCDPGTQNYTTTNSMSKDGLLAECGRHNDGDCATNTCCCETEYVRTILQLFMIQGVKLDRKKYHHNFDHEEKCHGVGNGGHEVDCCGEYPTRRMYNTHSRQCCENQSVFDPYTHVCCEDGQPGRSVADCDNPNRAAKRKRRASGKTTLFARR